MKTSNQATVLISCILVFFLFAAGCAGKKSFQLKSSSRALTSSSKTKPSGTFDTYTERLNNNIGYSQTREDIEDQIDQYVSNLEAAGAQGLREGIIRIPVVVHVIKHETTVAGYVDYVSIQNQIDILNSNFRKQNTSEIASLPTEIQNLAADTRIEFVLANRADNCAAEEFANGEPGVTRANTSQSPFVINPTHPDAYTRYPMKYSGAYGRDGFPHEDYLNIWVCELDGDACGYASLPGDYPPEEDGIVIDYRCFAGPQAESPFDQGKVLTQLVAQWLNLYNIWGIEPSCNDDDEVMDTPKQDDANSGCPTSASSCGNTGDLFMNFMDATHDNCRKFFTHGQVKRMDATLFTFRASLLNSSGLFPIPASGDPDIWMQDTPEDVGNEPNSESHVFWESQDIWIRNHQVPAGEVNPIHQNPISGFTNYVYVRVRNRACSGLQQGMLKVYWAKASTGLSYPYPWDGSVSQPVLLGGEIGSIPVTVVAGASNVYEIPWNNVPNPKDYEPYYGDKAHFCLLAVIETPSDNKPVPTPAGIVGVEWFVKNNNNVVWKNITIAETMGLTSEAHMMVSNFEKDEATIQLAFNTSEDETSPFTKGNVTVDLGKLYEPWKKGGKKGKHVKTLEGGKILLTADSSILRNIKIPAKSHYDITVAFSRDEKKITRPELLQLDVKQYVNESKEPIGGQAIYFKVGPSDSVPDSNWKVVDTGTKEDLYAAHFPSDQVGFAGGTGGCIIKTKDGGQSWKRSNNGIPSDFAMYAIYFVDEKRGFAVGNQGRLYVTENGGNAWTETKIGQSHLRDILFIDSKNGFIVADGAIFKTNDAGSTWKNVNHLLPAGIMPSDLKSAELYFIDQKTGFVLLDGKILKTTDSGNSWRIINVPGLALYDMDFIDAKNGYLCGIGTGLLKSANGGESWEKVTSFSNNTPQTVKFINYQEGFVGGISGEIYQTSNSANSWRLNAPLTDKDIHELIYLKSSNVMLAFGKKGVVLHKEF
ncbi:MAG: hypothetical protein CV087_20890 [Candidatus Brocadia sp. WS118]|nr:MAG: hypothetical protein CV087_20890 [Candidatus Brocadia sp. WS118]